MSKEQLAERFVAVEMRVSKAVSTMLDGDGPKKGESEKGGKKKTDDTLLKVHSNSLITDSSYMIRSSSNLVDRSIWNKVHDYMQIQMSKLTIVIIPLMPVVKHVANISALFSSVSSICKCKPWRACATRFPTPSILPATDRASSSLRWIRSSVLEWLVRRWPRRNRN